MILYLNVYREFIERILRFIYYSTSFSMIHFLLLRGVLPKSERQEKRNQLCKVLIYTNTFVSKFNNWLTVFLILIWYRWIIISVIWVSSRSRWSSSSWPCWSLNYNIYLWKFWIYAFKSQILVFNRKISLEIVENFFNAPIINYVYFNVRIKGQETS